MWKTWTAIAFIFSIGCIPKYLPAFLLTSPEATSSWIDVSAPEYWTPIFGMHVKITDSLVAVFTAALFVATLGLWISTRKLWLSGERQSAITRAQLEMDRAEFNYVHRPQLVVRRERIYFNPKDNGINFVLANIGDLPATQIIGNLNVRIVPNADEASFNRDSMPPYGTALIDVSALINRPPRNSPNIDGNQRAFIYYPTKEIDRGAINLLKLNQAKLYFFGHLQFSGPDQVQRQSYFFRTFVPDTEIFQRSEDRDYEQQ